MAKAFCDNTFRPITLVIETEEEARVLALRLSMASSEVPGIFSTRSVSTIFEIHDFASENLHRAFMSVYGPGSKQHK